jgi:hypothetical protein
MHVPVYEEHDSHGSCTAISTKLIMKLSFTSIVLAVAGVRAAYSGDIVQYW